MKNYELVTILPQQTENDLKEAVGEIEGFIKEVGGNVISSRLLSRGRLAYPVKNVRYGGHWVVYFETEPAKLAELKKNLQLYNGVVRFVVNQMAPVSIKPKEEKIAPSRGWAVRHEEPVVVEQKKEIPAEEKSTLEELDKKLTEILEKEI
jgi:ribosomal protein S6